MHQIKKILEQNFLKFFISTPAKKAVIGISGGIDSALTLAIASRAIGKEKIFAVLMPYQLGKISSEQNFLDAKEICDFFGVEYIVQKIDEMADPYEKIFKKNSMAFGNTLARIRMTILFGYANNHNGLVLGTCNKSEVMLGYETKFGDGAADINILGNLWKTEVWQLAKWYDIPEKFITKNPSAELFASHSDEQEMGFTYLQGDTILQTIDTKGENFSSDNDLEEKIFQMWKNSAHKRDEIPTLRIC